ncbi:MAG: dihydroorotate dehydrogenase [Phycisphaerales bacterium JB043]
MSRHDPSVLETTLAGIELRNPVLLAAGTAGYVDEMSDVLDLSRIGGLVTKSITAEAREGNDTWRVVPVRGGMLNAIGLANLGAEAFEKRFTHSLAPMPCEVIGSIAGSSIEDYVGVASMFERMGAVRAVEVNVSCPNTEDGRTFGEDPSLLAELIAGLHEVLRSTRLIVKLPPITNERDLLHVSRTCVDAGVDAITLANTTPAMAIDVHTRKARLANVTGGLSGPSVHPIVVRLVHLVYRGLARDAGLPIIGLGGVSRWEDAAELILAGASVVGMGTALFADPRAPLKIVKGLEWWVRDQGEETIEALVGRLES